MNTSTFLYTAKHPNGLVRAVLSAESDVVQFLNKHGIFLHHHELPDDQEADLLKAHAQGDEQTVQAYLDTLAAKEFGDKPIVTDGAAPASPAEGGLASTQPTPAAEAQEATPEPAPEPQAAEQPEAQEPTQVQQDEPAAEQEPEAAPQDEAPEGQTAEASPTPAPAQQEQANP